MPQLTAVTINDGAATPVATTFSPLGKDETGVFWFEQTSPAPSNVLGATRIGYKQMRAMARGTQLTTSSKVVYTISIPTLQTLGTADNGIPPPPTLAYVEAARIELTLPERGQKASRKNLRSFAMNLMAHAMAVANIDDLQPSYS